MTFPCQNHKVKRGGLQLTLIFCLVFSFFLCCTPAFAISYTYLDTGSQPDLVAHTEGDTRYYPGDTFQMSVLLTNKGRDTAMQVAPRLSAGAYDPSTALGVTVTPDAADAPVTLKTLPVVVGDIGQWDEARVTIYGTVRENATPGVYPIQIVVAFNYVYAIPMTDSSYSSINKLYNQKVQTLPARLIVMSEVKPSIISEKYENMVPGTQGYVIAEVRNTGYATGNKVLLGITPSDNITFQMVDEGVYLGRFGPDETASVRVRVAVKENTAAGSYPAVLDGKYWDADGIIHTIKPVHMGITVSRGAVIEAITKDLTISPGATETINVTYRNTGDTPAINAQARIIGNQVIIPVSDSVSLGILGPGESKTAQFRISAKSPIAGKKYDVDTEVKYQDELGALMLSEKMSFGILVQKQEGPGAILSNPVYLIIIAGIFAILIYAVWKLYQKRSLNNSVP